jgi:hypothetical protein
MAKVPGGEAVRSVAARGGRRGLELEARRPRVVGKMKR